MTSTATLTWTENECAEFADEALNAFPDDTPKQHHYFNMRVDGETHRMAEMCAARQPPGGGFSDRVLMEDHWGGKNLTDPVSASYYRGMARAEGVTTDGMTYCPQIASYPGDPTAWVDTVGDIKKVAEAKGMTLEGAINYKPTEVDLPQDDDGPYQVADDIVREEIVNEIIGTPGLAQEYQAKPQKLADRTDQLTKLFSGDQD